MISENSAVTVPRMTGWTDACITRNSLGEEVTSHSHYRNICHAYPGPDGEVMLAGHVLSPPLVRWFNEGQRKHSTKDPADRPASPCPSCDTPVDIEWLEITAMDQSLRQWIHGRIECPSNKRHDVSAAYAELSWPAELTEEDREWLRRQTQLAKEGT